MKELFLKSIEPATSRRFAVHPKTKTAGEDTQTKSRMILSKRHSRLVPAIALALIGVAAVMILPARATPQAGVSSVTLAHGTFDDIDVFAKTDIDPSNPKDYWKAMINTKGLSHLYVIQNTVVPGGTFGWHNHTGPSLVIVTAGTATEYEGNDPTSTPHVHPTGSTFVDAGEESGHLVRNEGSVNLVVTVVRIVPEGAVQRLDLPNPGYNPSLN